MKQYPQCMMCSHAMGRRCTLLGQSIPDDIYANEKKCISFHSLTDDEHDVDDCCCSENVRYQQEMKKYND